MGISIPTEPFKGRDPERTTRKAAATARAERRRELEEVKRDSLAVIEAGAPQAVGVTAKALAYMGLSQNADDPELARKQFEEARAELKLIDEADRIDDLYFRERDNRLSIDVCEELKPQFAAAYVEWIESLIETARRAMAITGAHRQLRERGVQPFVPQLLHGSSAVGHGKWDLGSRESWVCFRIREAVRVGYLSETATCLKGANWR